MSTLVLLVDELAIGLYILIGAAAIWYWRRWSLARFSYRATAFELERDLARYQSGNSITALVLLVEVALAVVGVQQVVAPEVRANQDGDDRPVVAIASDGEFATPTPPSDVIAPEFDTSGIDLAPDDNFTVFSTPTLTPTPVGTILPGAPNPIGCETPNAQLQIPANGMRLLTPIEVRGTAFTEDFAQFKLEIREEGSQNFGVFFNGSVPAEELSSLTQFNPGPYDPGTYEMRLTVFDIEGVLRASCQVTVEISDPRDFPTPTPLGG
jgi:hypothetical protein